MYDQVFTFCLLKLVSLQIVSGQRRAKQNGRGMFFQKAAGKLLCFAGFFIKQQQPELKRSGVDVVRVE